MEAPSERNETLARFNDAETKGMQPRGWRRKKEIDARLISRGKCFGEKNEMKEADDDDQVEVAC